MAPMTAEINESSGMRSMMNSMPRTTTAAEKPIRTPFQLLETWKYPTNGPPNRTTARMMMMSMG